MRWLPLFVSLLAQNPAESSVAQLERALTLRPREAQAYLDLAREYDRLGERRKAEATLRSGLAEAWETRTLRGALIEYLARAERWDDAIAEAAPIAKDSTGRTLLARLRVNAGLAAYRTGDTQRARARWEAALVNDSTMLEASVDLGALLLETGQRRTASQVVSRALRLHPTDARLLTLRARALQGSEAVTAAVRALRQRRSDQPQDEGTALELVSLLTASGQRVDAMALYDTLVHASSASERVFSAATEFWIDAMNFANAEQIAQSGIARFPRSAHLNELLGDVASARGEWQSSADAYRRAIRLTREPARREGLELALLEVFISAKDTTAGTRLARELRESQVSHAALLQSAQRVRSGFGAKALADSLYATLLQRDSADVDALEAGGELAEALGDTARAIAMYRRAAAQDSSGPIAPLALLRLTNPVPDSARQMLRRALWRGIELLQRLEVGVTAAVSGTNGRLSLRALSRMAPEVEEKNRVLGMLRSTLDTVVFHTDWGRSELATLQLAYPGSALLERYAADVAAAQGGAATDSVALAHYDKLLRRDVTTADVHVKRADLLLRQNRIAESAAGYARALDLDPENDETYRKLRELRQREGVEQLDDLLRQVRRLRVRLPQSRILAEHEIELLQRLGRIDEAHRVANELAQRKP